MLHNCSTNGLSGAQDRLNTYEKAPLCGAFAEPSNRLELLTPSLPWLKVSYSRLLPGAEIGRLSQIGEAG